MKIDYKKEYEEMLEIAINNKKLYEFETKEIERLNNIINELEKWLEELSYDALTGGYYRNTLLKLKALEGSDKE